MKAESTIHLVVCRGEVPELAPESPGGGGVLVEGSLLLGICVGTACAALFAAPVGAGVGPVVYILMWLISQYASSNLGEPRPTTLSR